MPLSSIVIRRHVILHTYSSLITYARNPARTPKMPQNIVVPHMKIYAREPESLLTLESPSYDKHTHILAPLMTGLGFARARNKLLLC